MSTIKPGFGEFQQPFMLGQEQPGQDPTRFDRAAFVGKVVSSAWEYISKKVSKKGLATGAAGAMVLGLVAAPAEAEGPSAVSSAVMCDDFRGTPYIEVTFGDVFAVPDGATKSASVNGVPIGNIPPFPADRRNIASERDVLPVPIEVAQQTNGGMATVSAGVLGFPAVSIVSSFAGCPEANVYTPQSERVDYATKFQLFTSGGNTTGWVEGTGGNGTGTIGSDGGSGGSDGSTGSPNTPPATNAKRADSKLKAYSTNHKGAMKVTGKKDPNYDYSFIVQQKRGKKWFDVTSATTSGPKETVTIDLGKGTYRAWFPGDAVHKAKMTKRVTLKK